jgi:acetoacetate decarboxylase
MKLREILRIVWCVAVVMMLVAATSISGNLKNALAEEGKTLPPPQLVTDAWMFIAAYKADPVVLKSLLPKGLEPNPENQVVINMYTVPDPNQTSGFGAYTLTYLTVELRGQDGYNMGQPTGYPGRYFVYYFNSSPSMREFTKKVGIPAQAGNTTTTVENGKLKAVVTVDGKPFIEATADVGDTLGGFGGGHLNYFGLIQTEKDGKKINQVVKYPIPYNGGSVKTENAKITFKVPEKNPLYRLKPLADPTWAVWMKGSFVYPKYEVINEF